MVIGAIIRFIQLPQCQWNNRDGSGKTSHTCTNPPGTVNISTTKQSKIKPSKDFNEVYYTEANTLKTESCHDANFVVIVITTRGAASDDRVGIMNILGL